MKYQIITFGCQFNQSDTERLTTVLRQLGYNEAGLKDQADLIIVLACSVRQSAIDRIYGLKTKWEKIRKKQPLITVLSGCVLAKDQKKMADFFDIFLPIKDLSQLPKLLAHEVLELPADYLRLRPSYHSNFQAYIPIINGCNNFCAYCVVPYVRGQEKSRPAQDIIKECEALIEKGYREITLLGQNVNSYHDGKIDFPRLLQLVDVMAGDYWLRFASSHPKDFSDDLIKAMKNGRHITPYLHLPVQAGDNEILKKMNRHYTVEHYKKLITKARRAIPGLSVSTDVIVGFPGETKKQFANTLKLFREVKFDMAYTAQYSERTGTAAAKLKDDVPKEEKKRREKQLTAVLKKTALAYNKKFVGKVTEVLVEKCKDGFCFGKTETFKTVKFLGNKNLAGKFVKVKINKAEAFGLFGNQIL